VTVSAITSGTTSTERRHQLVLSHLQLVRHILGKMSAQFPPGVDLENLEAAGVCGLAEAAANYDADRNTAFRSFAYLRIRGAIIDELRRNCPLPQRVLETVARVRRASRRLPSPVTVEALAGETGLTAKEVADCLAAVRLTRMVAWGPEAEPFATRLEDVARPEDALERAESKEQLARAVAALPERERTVVALYFREDLRLREISVVLGLSESRVSRLLNVALFRLGEILRAEAEECVPAGQRRSKAAPATRSIRVRCEDV
jgi:RNA polymerase sigma factor for flagellar operon FliA